MGNGTNLENWAARERLRWIERAVWWRGWIGRPDLAVMFGISAAQASSDLQKYQELNPGALIYQTSRKRYEGAEGMRCVMHRPLLEDAMATFLGEGGVMATVGEVREGVAVAMVRPPQRVVLPEVERRVFLAVAGGQELRVKYHSVARGTVEERVVVPRAFGHDGLRWHVRAWCRKREGWRDFVLGRISEVGWPMPVEVEPPVDEDWEAIETWAYRLHPGLHEEGRRALAMDYGVGADGIYRVSGRRAMRQYVEAMLRIPDACSGLPAHFERLS